jgi:hypothetical protein
MSYRFSANRDTKLNTPSYCYIGEHEDLEDGRLWGNKGSVDWNSDNQREMER